MNDLPVPRLSITPLRFEPSFEQVPDDEQQTSSELAETLHDIMQTTFKDNGHATRSVHAKSHGLLRGRMTVLDNLPKGYSPIPGLYRW